MSTPMTTIKKKGLVQNRHKPKLDVGGRTRLVGVSFLNAQPILHGLLNGLADDRMHLELAPPAELSRQLFEDEADAALAPVAALATHGGLEIVPKIAIGCDGAVKSVVLVSDVPLEDVEEVLLDASSRTSVVLARLILQHIRKSAPEPKYWARPAEEIVKRVGGKVAGLLIGDIALEHRGRFKHELDLGQAWKEWTGLPFVFAVWVARPGVLSERDVFVLEGSLQAGLGARKQIAEAWARGHGGDAVAYQQYLTDNIAYDLNDNALQGLREFLKRAGDAGLLPPTSLRFVGQAQESALPHRESIDSLLEFAAKGGRLSFEDAMRLGEEAPTHDLGVAADMRRKALHPEGVVTYIVDRNINYTNVCTTSCRFCAFYRPVNHDEGYVLTREQLGQKIQETIDAGGIQILLQGGLNPALHLEWYEDLFRWMKATYPSIALHALSPEEIWHLVRLEDLSVEDVLKRLKAAGMDSVPGGGAEVLTDRVRSKIAKAKCTSSEWIEVMRVAHRLGMRSTATMMFGTSDSLADRVAHLIKVRDLQDETGGFTAFICWDYQHEQGTKHIAGETGTVLYLRTQALSRLVLDNIDNIQSSWVTQGPGLGQLALRFGANDMGSTMFEENVVSSAGTTFGMDAAAIERHARASGFKVAQRNMRYQRLTTPA